MNFFNDIASAAMTRLNDKFNPNSAHFAQGGILGAAAPQAAPGIESANATPQQDAMARRAGFRNAEEMLAFQRNRNVDTGNNPTQGSAVMPHTLGQAGQQVTGSMLYPPNLLNYVLNAFKGANAGGQ